MGIVSKLEHSFLRAKLLINPLLRRGLNLDLSFFFPSSFFSVGVWETTAIQTGNMMLMGERPFSPVITDLAENLLLSPRQLFAKYTHFGSTFINNKRLL